MFTQKYPRYLAILLIAVLTLTACVPALAAEAPEQTPSPTPTLNAAPTDGPGKSDQHGDQLPPFGHANGNTLYEAGQIVVCQGDHLTGEQTSAHGQSGKTEIVLTEEQADLLNSASASEKKAAEAAVCAPAPVVEVINGDASDDVETDPTSTPEPTETPEPTSTPVPTATLPAYTQNGNNGSVVYEDLVCTANKPRTQYKWVTLVPNGWDEITDEVEIAKCGEKP